MNAREPQNERAGSRRIDQQLSEDELRALYTGLETLTADAFPKTCPCCGRTFATAEDFLYRETSCVPLKSGLRAANGAQQQPVVELFRNCPCGSTLLATFRERRDRSPAGRRRRARFGRLLAILERAGIDRDSARRELLALLRGGRSPYLERRGIRFAQRTRTG